MWDKGLVGTGRQTQLRLGPGPHFLGTSLVEAEPDPSHLGQEVASATCYRPELGRRHGGLGLGSCRRPCRRAMPFRRALAADRSAWMRLSEGDARRALGHRTLVRAGTA
jgi:hypothetical protein